MDYHERYKRLEKRRGLKQEAVKQEKYPSLVPDERLVRDFLQSEVNTELIESVTKNGSKKYDVDTHVVVNQQEIDSILREIRGQFDHQKFQTLIEGCKDSVLDSIVKPFGLSGRLFKDQDGGNVTTVHNFKQQAKELDRPNGRVVVASDEDYERALHYKNSLDNYSRKDYENRTFKNKRKAILKEEGDLIDSYTGKVITKDGRSQLDHVVSAHEIDQDPRTHLFMNKDERVSLANSDSNLKMTHHSINQSKSNLSMDEWLDKEERNGTTKAERFEVDSKKAREIDAQSRKVMTHKLREAQLQKQGLELAKTGASEGLKMGMQQALGLLMREFAESVFWEIKDIYRNGLYNGKTDESFMGILKQRFERVGTKVLSKWKDVAMAFKDGVISGFFSNLITFIINSFVTTSSRVVKIIREGFFSLVKAIKLLISPPEGLTSGEVAHEATKLVASALVVSGGVLIEEGVDQFLKTVPGVNVFSGLLTPVIMGIITGISATIVVYMIDKVDLFGVEGKAKHDFVMGELENKMETSLKSSIDASAVFLTPRI